jgi:lysophospholipase L1-like esterase
MRIHLFRNVLLILALALASAAAAAPSRRPHPAWIATWAASPTAADPDPADPLLNIEHQTVRQRMRLSIGGDQLRIRLSNEHGSTPLRLGSATVALASDAATVRPESRHALTFGGRSSVTLPPGAPILSDAVDFRVAAGAEISISLYFPDRVLTPTVHSLALKRAIVSARGDFTNAERIETQAESHSSILITAVLVPAQPGQRLVLAFGDSVTDGDGSTVDADRTWPQTLARRLRTKPNHRQTAVVNAGIAGNRLLSDGFGIKSLGISALARFDRDALTMPGVTHIVLLEGLNDLGFARATLRGRPLADSGETRTVADLIGAYGQLIERAHARGVRVIGATLLPFERVDLAGYYSAAKEFQRQAVNAWIRTSGAFDAVIDFDAVVRDAAHPGRLDARYDSGDHLHPNDTGYQAMADAIDLSLFAADPQAETDRLFELNIYHTPPGKVPALAARFRDASTLQSEHGLNVIGYWMPHGDPKWNDTFIYIVAHSSRGDADRHWHAFHDDPRFQKYVKAEEAEHLIEKVDTVYMSPMDYSQTR